MSLLTAIASIAWCMPPVFLGGCIAHLHDLSATTKGLYHLNMLQSRAEQKKIHKQQTYYRTCLNRNGKNMYSVYLIKVRTSSLLSYQTAIFLGMFSPLPTCHWLSGWVFQQQSDEFRYPSMWPRYRPLGQLFLHCSLEPQI